MPIHEVDVECTDGKMCRGYQWGTHGHIYTFEEGNEQSRKEAYALAQRQARAAYAHGYHH